MSGKVRMDAYLRVSRVNNREGPSYISPSVQREAIERWATYKDVEIAEWHLDEDQSGGATSRPGLDLAVQRAVSGETNGIVSWKIDRFSRATEQGLRDLRRLAEVDARLGFVVEDIDTSGPIGRLVYTIMLAQAEYFLEQIKASWRESKRRAVDRGAYIAKTPFGYERLNDGTIAPDPVEGPFVTRAFEIAAATGAVQTAMHHLAEVAPERTWTTFTVRRLLASRVYLGEARNGEFFNPRAHEPLVSRQTWEAAQHESGSRRASTDYPFSGVLRCATCGGPMVGGRGGKGQRTYRCRASQMTSKDRCDRGANVTAYIAEDYLAAVGAQVFAGLRLIGSRPVGNDADRFEREMINAEEELDAFASDLTARRALGERYHAHLEERARAVEEARAAFRSQARDTEKMNLIAAEDIEEPAVLIGFLSRLFARIDVRPGRGIAISDRLVFVPRDAKNPPRMPSSHDL